MVRHHFPHKEIIAVAEFFAEVRNGLEISERPSSNSMKEALKPFQKIIVAYDDSPAARDALTAGIELRKLLGKPLETVTVIEPPPMYTASVLAADPNEAECLETDRKQHYYQIMESAVAEERQHRVEVTGHLVEAEDVDRVISFLRTNRAALLVIGLRQFLRSLSYHIVKTLR